MKVLQHALSRYVYMCIMGVARIFQRGGHTDSYIGYSPNYHLNIVGCLLTKRLTKGGSRAPQDPPPPGYAHDVYNRGLFVCFYSSWNGRRIRVSRSTCLCYCYSSWNGRRIRVSRSTCLCYCYSSWNDRRIRVSRSTCLCYCYSSWNGRRIRVFRSTCLCYFYSSWNRRRIRVSRSTCPCLW